MESCVLLGDPLGLMGPGWSGDCHSTPCWVVGLPTLSRGAWVGLWLDLCCQCDHVTARQCVTPPQPSLAVPVRGGEASSGLACPGLAILPVAPGNGPSLGLGAGIADLPPFNYSGLGWFMLFSGYLLNFILKIRLRSIQNRFLIALSLKSDEQN